MSGGSANPLRLLCVVGARPNFPKVAPILRAARGQPWIRASLVHTGQHYDERMSDLFFRELGLPAPDVHLGVGSGSHAVQTAKVMIAFDQVLDRHPADLILVVGDVNSTIACALVAIKRGVGVAHVEAGLRSGDLTMPEEINRILTDQISTMLFTTERGAADNLRREGVADEKIHFVGNVMIDTLRHQLGQARQTGIQGRLGVESGRYILCTLHRPSNVDTIDAATVTVEALTQLAARLPLVVPLHPRSLARLEEYSLLPRLKANPQVTLIEPLGYLEFLSLMDTAAFVFTDSGGIQEETTALGVPCLTFRENTERPITVTHGTNQLVGRDPQRVVAAADRIIGGDSPRGRIPELWDGAAAGRILAVIEEVYRRQRDVRHDA